MYSNFLKRLKKKSSTASYKKEVVSQHSSGIQKTNNTGETNGNGKLPKDNSISQVTTHTNEEPANPQYYILQRDYRASSRLNLQFYLWKDALGFTLHPTIPPPVSDNRVADIATGTGIWLHDVSRSVPASVHLDGFDISLAQAPPKQWLPSNIHLAEWNMYEKPPDELIGQYDIVHVRLIMLALRDGDPLPIVKNLRKLLKPGGYLQWDEVDRVKSYVKTVNDDVKPHALESLFTPKVDGKHPASASDKWQDNLVEILHDNGFEQGTAYRYENESGLERYFHDMYMTAFDEVLPKLPIADQGKLSQATGYAELEAQRGAAVAFPKLVWVAKAV